MIEKSNIRPAAVAGGFYPDHPNELREMVHEFLADAPTSGETPSALIAPHAGYIYSGPIAGTAYAQLRAGQKKYRRVIVLGPSHHVAFRGMAVSTARGFDSPLGVVEVDADLTQTALEVPAVRALDAAHKEEHGIEVHLPFLQLALGHFTFLPLVVGDATPKEVAELLRNTWTSPDTLVVVSSDLSHYHDYKTAQRMDAATSGAIESLRPEDIGVEQACGRLPIQGLLIVAKERKLRATTLDLRNSGDTAGSPDRVVGYGAYAFIE